MRSLLLGLIVLCCTSASLHAEMFFRATLDASQVPGGTSTETGTAVAIFALDDEQMNLSYTIQIQGLDLKPNPDDRTEFSDIDKIHLHNGFVGSTGPHVLNIFGLPSEDDAEMFVDFENEIITGVYNDADAIDPNTNELFDQNDPANTKLLANFVDDLLDGQLYLAIHSAGQNGGVAIRGQLVAVPEPASAVVILAGGLVAGMQRRRR
ncbi:MAG: CHRD domain-containing protein [Planctomycetota bacterium]